MRLFATVCLFSGAKGTHYGFIHDMPTVDSISDSDYGSLDSDSPSNLVNTISDDYFSNNFNSISDSNEQSYNSQNFQSISSYGLIDESESDDVKSYDYEAEKNLDEDDDDEDDDDEDDDDEDVDEDFEESPESDDSSGSMAYGFISDDSFWSIDGYSLATFLEFQNYGVFHWGVVITALLVVVSVLAYYYVFRKNARYRHLIPSAKTKKPSYDRLDDEETYTYDEESPRIDN